MLQNTTTGTYRNGIVCLLPKETDIFLLNICWIIWNLPNFACVILFLFHDWIQWVLKVKTFILSQSSICLLNSIYCGVLALNVTANVRPIFYSHQPMEQSAFCYICLLKQMQHRHAFFHVFSFVFPSTYTTTLVFQVYFWITVMPTFILLGIHFLLNKDSNNGASLYDHGLFVIV